jgi:hypothetical protein
MDLARDAAMAAESRAKLGEHAQACPQCAAQVASERSLTAGLRALAGSNKNESAPPRVEAALKAAFRKQAMPSAAPATAFTFSDLAIRSGIGLAAAAVVLVSFLAPGISNLHPGAKVLNKQEHQAPALSPKPGQKPDGQKEPSAAASANTVDNHQNAMVSDRAGSRSPDRKPVHRSARRGGDETAEGTDGRDGFIPLPYGEEFNPLEGGQVVRVKLPRSMLASFGIAVNMETGDEPVRADLVLGNDGVPRSIRLIDNSLQSR